MLAGPSANGQQRARVRRIGAARYVDKILKGANPGDLPIRYPARYFLTLNNTAAKNLGLTFPRTLVEQADRVLP